MDLRQLSVFFALLLVIGLASHLGIARAGSGGVSVPGEPGGAVSKKEQIAITIYQTGKSLGANHKAILAAFEAAIVESGMRNLKGGDRDSVGVFQQRPSTGWGSPKQLLQVDYAAKAFYKGNPSDPRPKGAIHYSKSSSLSAGEVAQKVQRSAFPGRYDQVRQEAERWIDKVS